VLEVLIRGKEDVGFPREELGYITTLQLRNRDSGPEAIRGQEQVFQEYIMP
jgi:hypothetical protein